MAAEITTINPGANVEEPWFLRPKDAERLCGLSVKTLYAAIYAGTLPARKFRGRGWLIRREDLLTWIEKESVPNVA